VHAPVAKVCAGAGGRGSGRKSWYQINGRVRGKVQVESGMGEEELKKLVLSDPKVTKLLDGLHIVKVVVVPDKSWSTWWWDRKCVSHFFEVKDWGAAYLSERLPHDTAQF